MIRVILAAATIVLFSSPACALIGLPDYHIHTDRVEIIGSPAFRLEQAWYTPWLPLGGVILGFSLAQFVEWRRRMRRLQTALAHLYADLATCRQHAAGYREAGIAAPLGRMPTTAFDEHLGFIVAEANLNADEITALTVTYGLVQQINRGLDNAADAAADHDEARIKKEAARTAMKCEKFVRPDTETANAINRSMRLIERRLKAARRAKKETSGHDR